MSEANHLTLSGNLDLVCAADHRRRTYLASQEFSAPLHLSKTYWNGETLLINVVNQTAGIFGGDQIRTHVLMEPGACVLLTSPSAARFHPSHGREARLKQTFEVRSGASLDVFPEISIPQRDSRSFQETLIHVEEGGELLYLETVTPGRVASGEIFAFASYRWATAIHLAGRLVLRERACLSPEGKSLTALRALYPASYYSSMTLLSPAAANWSMDFARTVSELGDPDLVKIAASKLSSGGWSIRLLAKDSLALRRTISRLRDLIYQRFGRKTPDPRRN